VYCFALDRDRQREVFGGGAVCDSDRFFNPKEETTILKEKGHILLKKAVEGGALDTG